MGRSFSFGALCLIAAALVGAAAHSSPAPHRYTFSAPHMGTEFRIVLYAEDEARASAAASAAFRRIAALDARLSDYRADSELTRVGERAGGEAIGVSGDLFRVLSHAQRMARASGGAFDPTCGPLTLLWRRARRTSEMPDDSEIAGSRALVGHGRLVLNERARTVRLLKKGMRLDLGGIAKGFAADEAANVLASRGIARALVAAGGDIVVRGSPPGTDGWSIAVAAVDSGTGVARHVRLRDAAISTSGDREQWFVHAGVRYCHIIDPRTGWPVTGASSATVIARLGADADALATAVAVLGPDQGLSLIDRVEGASAFVQRRVAERVQWFVSRGWKE